MLLLIHIMDDATFLGMLITALVVIVGLFISLCTPLIRLNKTIQKLNDSIDRINDEANKREARLDKMTLMLEQHSKWLVIDKNRLDNQSKRLNKLDGEVGFIDNERRL